jgi:hypothetical protein
MELNRPAVEPTGDGELGRHQLSCLLDELVAMHWDLSRRLRNDSDLPAILAVHLQRLGDELNVTIGAVKTLIGPPL